MATKTKPPPKAKAKGKPSGDDLPKGKLADFPIEMLKFEPELQARVGDASLPVGGLFSYHVEDLRAAIRRGEKLPPVQVWAVPGRGNLVTDGHHSTEAYRLEGRKKIPCEVHEGSWLDAVKAAAQANAQHRALKRTGDDKRRAVKSLLTALREAGESWTNARVAKWVRVSDDLVGSVLLRMAPDHNGPAPTAKLGADGKVYKADVGAKKAKVTGKTPETPETPKPEAEKPAEKTADPSLTMGADKTPAPAPVPVTSQSPAVFDFPAFETHVGVIERDIDKAAGAYNAKLSKRADGLRRLLREFKAEFTGWVDDLKGPKS